MRAGVAANGIHIPRRRVSLPRESTFRDARRNHHWWPWRAVSVSKHAFASTPAKRMEMATGDVMLRTRRHTDVRLARVSIGRRLAGSDSAQGPGTTRRLVGENVGRRPPHPRVPDASRHHEWEPPDWSTVDLTVEAHKGASSATSQPSEPASAQWWEKKSKPKLTKGVLCTSRCGCGGVAPSSQHIVWGCAWVCEGEEEATRSCRPRNRLEQRRPEAGCQPDGYLPLERERVYEFVRRHVDWEFWSIDAAFKSGAWATAIVAGSGSAAGPIATATFRLRAAWDARPSDKELGLNPLVRFARALRRAAQRSATQRRRAVLCEHLTVTRAVASDPSATETPWLARNVSEDLEQCAADLFWVPAQGRDPQGRPTAWSRGRCSETVARRLQDSADRAARSRQSREDKAADHKDWRRAVDHAGEREKELIGRSLERTKYERERSDFAIQTDIQVYEDEADGLCLMVGIGKG